jgi:hypothetical protein
VRSTNDYFLHDLRNRLTVARGFVQLIRSGRAKDNPKKQEEYLGIAEDAISDAMMLLTENEDQFRKEDPVTENQYQAKLIKKLRDMFPGCEILKNDSGYKQGIPDLTIIWGPFWAMLDPKTSKTAAKQPNQEYFIEKLGKMSFASFIYPENEKEVLAALQKAFTSRRSARVPQS